MWSQRAGHDWMTFTSLHFTGEARLPVTPCPGSLCQISGSNFLLYMGYAQAPMCQQLCGVCSHHGPLIHCWSILGKSSSKAKQTDKFCNTMHWHFIAWWCGGFRGSKNTSTNFFFFLMVMIHRTRETESHYLAEFFLGLNLLFLIWILGIEVRIFKKSILIKGYFSLLQFSFFPPSSSF